MTESKFCPSYQELHQILELCEVLKYSFRLPWEQDALRTMEQWCRNELGVREES